jgi:hypothetical protein
MATAKSSIGPVQLAPLSIARTIWKRKLLILLCWVTVSVTIAIVVYKLALILVDAQKIPEKYVAFTVSTDVQDRLATTARRTIISPESKR